MKRYYFDLRDGDDLAIDEEGTKLPDMTAVQEEAALSLAGMARDARGTARREVRRHHRQMKSVCGEAPGFTSDPEIKNVASQFSE